MIALAVMCCSNTALGQTASSEHYSTTLLHEALTLVGNTTIALDHEQLEALAVEIFFNKSPQLNQQFNDLPQLPTHKFKTLNNTLAEFYAANDSKITLDALKLLTPATRREIIYLQVKNKQFPELLEALEDPKLRTIALNGRSLGETLYEFSIRNVNLPLAESVKRILLAEIAGSPQSHHPKQLSDLAYIEAMGGDTQLSRQTLSLSAIDAFSEPELMLRQALIADISHWINHFATHYSLNQSFCGDPNKELELSTEILTDVETIKLIKQIRTDNNPLNQSNIYIDLAITSESLNPCLGAHYLFRRLSFESLMELIHAPNSSIEKNLSVINNWVRRNRYFL